MFNKIKKIFKSAFNFVYCKLNAVAYAKSIGVKIGNGTKIYGGNQHMFSTEPWIIEIGDNCHITSDVLFLTHDGGTLIIKEFVGDYILTGSIIVGDNTYIGTRTTILPGIKIGSNCIIGAGSVVTRDIPDNSVVVGVPARVVNTLEGYTEKIKMAMDGKFPQYYESLEAVRKLDPLKRYD